MSVPGAQDIEGLRGYLLRFATQQLRDPALAEDVVQETLLAVLDARSGFSGKSAYRTWVVGILKNKIIDAIRKQLREQTVGDREDILESETADEMFEADGHWRQFPSDWGDPEKSLEDKEFWEVFEHCLESLPARAARVFMMREIMGVTGEETCKELAITQTNLWVMLHRARLGLRACLEARWFGRSGK